MQDIFTNKNKAGRCILLQINPACECVAHTCQRWRVARQACCAAIGTMQRVVHADVELPTESVGKGVRKVSLNP